MSASLNPIGVSFSDGTVQTTARTLANTVTSVNGSPGDISGLAHADGAYSWVYIWTATAYTTAINVRANFGEGVYLMNSPSDNINAVFMTSGGRYTGVAAVSSTLPTEFGPAIASFTCTDVCNYGGGVSGSKGHTAPYTSYLYKLIKT